MAEPRRILGLDPGLGTTGYGVLELAADGPRVVEAGVIRTEKGNLAGRIKTLFDGVVEILEEWKPHAVAVEQLYAHYDHPRTAILMAHARGAFFLAAAQRGLSITSYASTKVKKLITGHGRATKEQMQYTVMRELNLAKLPEPHDVADALAIALCRVFADESFTRGGISMTSKGVNRAMLLGESSKEGNE